MKTIRNVQEKKLSYNRKIVERIAYILLWQISLIIATKEWALLIIGLGAVLIIDIPASWKQLASKWFSINNWVAAISLTMLYTMIGKGIAADSLIFYFKRLLLIGINAISFSFMLNSMREYRHRDIKQDKKEFAFQKVIIYTSQLCICILILGGYLKNPSSGSTQFDQYVGINSISQIIAMVCLFISVIPIVKVTYTAKTFLQSCLFSITTILLISSAQSRMTSAVMMTILIFLTGYITSKKKIKALGLIMTAGWSLYYSIILPILVLLAPAIHQHTNIAKILYTATGSRYSLAWSGNIWHENGLNFLNNEKASSILPFLEKSYYTDSFIENYAPYLNNSKQIMDKFIPNGPHSMPIDLLLGVTKVVDDYTIPQYVWGLSGILIIALIKEYYTIKTKEISNKEILMANTCLNALILSVITTQTQGTIYLPFSIATSLLIISYSKKPPPKPSGTKKELTANKEDNNDQLFVKILLLIGSPLLILAPFVIFTLSYLISKVYDYQHLIN